MKNFALREVCLGAVLLFATQAKADSFIVRGLGGLSCGKLLETSKDEVGRAEIADWLNGYITSYNYYASKSLLPPDKETIIAFAETYCRNNPLSNIVVTGAVLVQELGGPKVTFQYKR